MKGKEEAELWLVGCVSFFGVPIEASSEGQGLEQREKSEGATERHSGLDMETEEALGAGY